MVGVFCSGSRGAYIGFLASMAAYVIIWSLRKALQNKRSLTPAIVGLIGVMSFATIVTLIIVWPRAHNLVLGGGMEAYSDQGRVQQWEAGIPYIAVESAYRPRLRVGRLRSRTKGAYFDR